MRRGQSLTFFIIIGIGLVLIFAILYQLSAEQEKRAFERKAVPTIQQVPTEAQPVFAFITECVRQTAHDAFIRLGDRGGYIDTSSFQVIPLNPTESQGVSYDSSSDFVIPYWYEMQPPNNCEKGPGCTFTTRRPPLRKTDGPLSIESQVDAYVAQTLPDCFRGFESFKERAISVTADPEISADTLISNNGVSIYVEMPVEIRTASATHTLESYQVNFNDFKFKDIYDAASIITELQANHSYLEKAMMNLITLYSGVDGALPPVGATQFGFGPGEYWIKRNVQQQIRDNILAPYIPLLQVFGTANYHPITTDKGGPLSTTREVLYNRGMVIPLGESTTYPHLTSTLSYLPIWDPYFDLNCDGEICSAMSGQSSFVVYLGIQRYQFAYDLSFPVLVSLSQPTAFNSRGYQFSFALEANLRNNQPVASGLDIIIPPNVGDILPTNPFEDIEARTSGIFTINVFSGKTPVAGLPIPAKDASISYLCGSDKVALGIAREGTLITRLPRCLNGIINAKLPEGGNGIVKVNSITEKDQQVNISVQSLRTLNASFAKLHLFRQTEWSGEGDKRHIVKIKWLADPESPLKELRDYEEATVVLRKLPAFEGEDPFMVVTQIYGPDSSTLDPCTEQVKQDSRENIKILPGRYQANIIAMSYHDIEIPEETRKGGGISYAVEGVTDTQAFQIAHYFSPVAVIANLATEEEYDIPGVSFNCSSPLIISNYETNFTLTPAMLDSGDTITFKGFSFELETIEPGLRRIEDLQAIGAPAMYATAFKDALSPQVVRRSRR